LPHTLTTAKDVSEHLLDRTGTAMMADDFDAFAECFAVPHEIHTFEGHHLLETRADLREVFDRVRAYYLRENVSDMVRHCVSAEFRNEKTVAAVHESRLVSGDRLVQDPYSVLSIICFVEGTWQITRSDYAIDNPKALVQALAKECTRKCS